MPEITSITSEALQATIRRLLPSQQGFGNDLQATNLITPIIDLTPTAEGSALEPLLQRAWDFSTGSNIVGTTKTTIISTSGFWKVDLNALLRLSSASSLVWRVAIEDSAGTSKDVWVFSSNNTPSAGDVDSTMQETFIVYLRAGDILTATAGLAGHEISIWYRQVADVSGNLTQPLGFTGE